MSKLEGKWERDGKTADARSLAEGAQLARTHRRKMAKSERDARQSDANARKVGASIRRAAREQQQRYIGWFTVEPKRQSGRNAGQRRLSRFETMAGLKPVSPSHVGGDGFSSFHFSWRSRGLRPRKSQKQSHRYRRGEAVRLIKYILRDSAREIEGGGIVSNIGNDPDDIATLFGALEELEIAAGQQNANVYISIVVSLPHELDSVGRERALTRIVQAIEEEQLPFAAVLHKPDPGTDQRNYHAHVILSLRPFRREKDGRYAFAALPAADLNDEIWISPLRRHIASALNEQMAHRQAETGIPQRMFTALSNAERGLAPKTKAEGKYGPGRKAADRRAEAAEQAGKELLLRAERASVLDQLAGLVTGVIAVPVLDVSRLVERARQAVDERRRSREAERVASTAVSVEPDQADKPAAPLPAPVRPSLALLRARDRAIAAARATVAPEGVVPVLQRLSTLSAVPTLSSLPVMGGSRGEEASAQPRQPTAAERHELEVAWVLDALNKLGPLPLRRQVVSQDGRETASFRLAPELATSDDAAAIGRAALVERDARVQAILAAQWELFLSLATSALTTSKDTRPRGKVIDIFAADPRLRVAALAANKDAVFEATLEQARDYWTARGQPGAEASPTSSVTGGRSPVQTEDEALVDLAADPVFRLHNARGGSGR